MTINQFTTFNKFHVPFLDAAPKLHTWDIIYVEYVTTAYAICNGKENECLEASSSYNNSPVQHTMSQELLLSHRYVLNTLTLFHMFPKTEMADNPTDHE